MDSLQAPPAPTSTSHAFPRLRRWGARLFRIGVFVYLGLCLALYLFQNVIIFPGAYVRRGAGVVVQPAPGREVLALHTSDGKPVAAIFGAALDANGLARPDAASRPTILYFYGNGDCVQTSLGAFQRFRRLGANVLIPEFVGYPMSGGKPTEDSFYATADAAYAYLLTRPDIDPKHIFVVGRSLGSAAAIDLAMRKPVEGLACFSAFTRMSVMARKVMPMFPTGLFLRSKFDNLEKIARVKCPIYLAHGTADDFVPFAMMAQLAGAARGPVVTFPIPGADRNNIYSLGGRELFRSFETFLDSLSTPRPGTLTSTFGTDRGLN